MKISEIAAHAQMLSQTTYSQVLPSRETYTEVLDVTFKV